MMGDRLLGAQEMTRLLRWVSISTVYKNGDKWSKSVFVIKTVTFVKITVTFVNKTVTIVKITVTFVKITVTFFFVKIRVIEKGHM